MASEIGMGGHGKCWQALQRASRNRRSYLNHWQNTVNGDEIIHYRTDDPIIGYEDGIARLHHVRSKPKSEDLYDTFLHGDDLVAYSSCGIVKEPISESTENTTSSTTVPRRLGHVLRRLLD